MSQPIVTLFVAVETRNESNGSHGHWRAKALRRKAVHEAVGYALLQKDWRRAGKPSEATPWVVHLTRITTYAPRMDDDGVVSSGKAVRDAFARFVGVDDKRRDVVSYRYDQQKGDGHGWLIEVFQSTKGAV